MKRREFLRNSLVLGGTVLGCAGWVDFLMPRLVIGHPLLRPPGALSESQFLTRCIQCMRCVDSCPNRAIVPYTDAPDRREQGTPVIRARRQACMLCNGVRGEFLRCTEVCPTGALRRVKKDPDNHERTTHEAIARAHDVRSAPVVAFWDGAGQPVADPLKGMLLPDFYSAYLDAALETARSRLAARG